MRRLVFFLFLVSVHSFAFAAGSVFFPPPAKTPSPTFFADPSREQLSLGYRYTMGWPISAPTVYASFGVALPLYLYDTGNRGRLGINLTTSSFSLFDISYGHLYGTRTGLLTVDYTVGIPISYEWGAFSLRFRPYHLSSHLGDNLARTPSLSPHYKRERASFNALDLFGAYTWADQVRLYIGVGFLTNIFIMLPGPGWYVEYGADGRYPVQQGSLVGSFLGGVHARQWESSLWSFDLSFLGGYELTGEALHGWALRFLLEAHTGPPLNGQWRFYPGKRTPSSPLPLYRTHSVGMRFEIHPPFMGRMRISTRS